MIRVEAIDMDLSAKFGNDSLVYSVVGCEPDPFKFYMDKKTGDMYSALIVDADSDELGSYFDCGGHDCSNGRSRS